MAYNVLIVDDSQTMRKVIRKTVTLSGFAMGDCWEAGDGQEALEVVKTHNIDLILSDLNMPRMNGLEMVKKLGEDEGYRHIPVVLITTDGSQERLEEAQALGVKGYLQKPFHPEAIRDLLTRVMESSHV